MACRMCIANLSTSSSRCCAYSNSVHLSLITLQTWKAQLYTFLRFRIIGYRMPGLVKSTALTILGFQRHILPSLTRFAFLQTRLVEYRKLFPDLAAKLGSSSIQARHSTLSVQTPCFQTTYSRPIVATKTKQTTLPQGLRRKAAFKQRRPIQKHLSNNQRS